MAPYESRGGFDYGGSPPLSNGIGSAHKSSFGMDPYVNGPPPKSQQPQAYPPQSYAPSVQIASQTPYGPHIPIVSNGQAAVSNGPQGNQHLNEDISTIFVVGFPEDMQVSVSFFFCPSQRLIPPKEREFQNMFTFSPGFEAATLKIPTKQDANGGYTGMTGQATGARAQGFSQQYAGQNDPYNLVTVHQGGVVVDGGRDGTMSSWGPDDGPQGYMSPNPMQPGAGGPPRKQIIGFAKFRSRDEALAARDVLQGRRVDIEKGAVLKAEMAKKNLHTKRGPGLVSGSGGMPPSAPGNMGSISGLNQLPGGLVGNVPMNVPSDHYALPPGLPTDQVPVRERDYTALGQLSQWREPQLGSETLALGSAHGVDEDRRRDREASVLHAMGVNGGGPSRGPRERAEEDWERRTKENDMRLLRGQNSAAFDAFHSVPPQSAPPTGHRGLDSASLGPAPPISSNGHSPSLHHDEAAHQYDAHPPAPLSSSSHRSSSPSSRPYSPTREDEFHTNGGIFTNPFAPLQHHAPQSSASSSSGNGGGHVGSNGSDDAPLAGDATLIPADKDIQYALGNLDLSTSSDVGNSSPELPSPSSNASSMSARNMVDQNPPVSHFSRF